MTPRLFYRATDPDAFRFGEWAVVVGQSTFRTRDGTEKLFFDVEYPDGVTDQCPVEGGRYEVQTNT